MKLKLNLCGEYVIRYKQCLSALWYLQSIYHQDKICKITNHAFRNTPFCPEFRWQSAWEVFQPNLVPDKFHYSVIMYVVSSYAKEPIVSEVLVIGFLLKIITVGPLPVQWSTCWVKTLKLPIGNWDVLFYDLSFPVEFTHLNCTSDLPTQS